MANTKRLSHRMAGLAKVRLPDLKLTVVKDNMIKTGSWLKVRQDNDVIFDCRLKNGTHRM